MLSTIQIAYLDILIDGKYRMDSKLVENNQRPVAVGRKEYLFCGNDDAA